MKKIAMVAFVGMALSGCSAGPGKGDVEEALTQFIQQNAGVQPTFEGLEIGECKKPESGPGYACSVSGTAKFQLGTRTQSEQMAATYIFDKVGGDWKVVGTR